MSWREYINWVGMFVGIVIVWAVLLAGLFLSAFYALHVFIEGVSDAGGLRPAVEQLWCGSPGCLGGGS